MSRKNTTPDPSSRPDRAYLLRLRVAVKAMALLLIAGFAYLLLSFAHSPDPQRSNPLTALGVADLAPGELSVVEWDGRRVIILHRTPEMVSGLIEAGEEQEPDPPAGVHRLHRAQLPEFLVVVGHGVPSGCPVEYVPPGPRSAAPLSPWPGGFRDPCSGNWYDAAGRDVAGVVASLRIPPHHFPTRDTLVIGEARP